MVNFFYHERGTLAERDDVTAILTGFATYPLSAPTTAAFSVVDAQPGAILYEIL